jgi:hypothetical protein
MEIDEGFGENRVYDPDLDDKENIMNNDNTNNGDLPPDAQKKKINRKAIIKFDPNYLVDNPNGLKRLYKHFVIEADKNL